MAYRELRNFTEIMRSLGYPRPVSIDNFRTPNFELVAELLAWLVMRYDPMASIPQTIDTENDRVEFLLAAARVMASKARVTLKAKNLYAADGRAVRELLKIASMLYQAVRVNRQTAEDAVEDDEADPGAALAGRVTELHSMREMSSEIVERGAKLFDLLQNEESLKPEREQALRFLDAASGGNGRAEYGHMESSIRTAIAAVQEEVEAKERQAAELAKDEAALQGNIEKTTAELERTQKRLATLQSVRPAFMDEYEALEAELAAQYDEYVTKFRNLDYLDSQLAELDRREKAKAEASNRSLAKLRQKLREEDLEAFRGDERVEGAGQVPAAEPVASGVPSPTGAAAQMDGEQDDAPGVVAGRPSGAHGRRAVMGTMAGGDDEDSDEGDDDDDDEGDEDEFGSDLGSSDDDGVEDDEDDDDDDDF